jgi:hypothetical protein
MNVVRSLIVVDDLEILIDLEGQDMRRVPAAFLGENRWLRGRGDAGRKEIFFSDSPAPRTDKK